ncbi:MAG: hypothetical protein K1X94_06905 [Sandaracinaceae bacterium]|nr:hypothetical protein [Sandaracinaceae bacterium]
MSRTRSGQSFLVGVIASMLALFSGLPACGSGAQCALDSDCALGLRCNTQNQCVPRGAGDVDAAVEERDSGPRPDAAAVDAPGPDAFAFDAFTPPDAASDADLDAPIDAFDDCPALAPMYNVDHRSLACTSNATTVSFSRLPGCQYEVTSDRTGDLMGILSHSPGMPLSGTLSFPDGMGRTCTVEPIGDAASMVCGTCTIDLVPPA